MRMRSAVVNAYSISIFVEVRLTAFCDREKLAFTFQKVNVAFERTFLYQN